MTVDQRLLFALPLALLAACAPDNTGPAFDPDPPEPDSAATAPDRATRPADPVSARAEPAGAAGQADAAENLADAEEQIDEAVAVVDQMRADPEVAELLSMARGIFIVPDYAQAGLIVGGEGGEGIALLKNADAPGGEWSAPAFFDFGSVTAGAAAGVEVGAIAMLLMNEEAARPFLQEENNFSLVSDATLTIVDFSARAEGDANMGDIIVWSDTEGAFAGATIGIRDINRDDDEIDAVYGQGATATEILSGNRDSAQAERLRSALAG